MHELQKAPSQRGVGVGPRGAEGQVLKQHLLPKGSSLLDSQALHGLVLGHREGRTAVPDPRVQACPGVRGRGGGLHAEGHVY